MQVNDDIFAFTIVLKVFTPSSIHSSFTFAHCCAVCHFHLLRKKNTTVVVFFIRRHSVGTVWTDISLNVTETIWRIEWFHRCGNCFHRLPNGEIFYLDFIIIVDVIFGEKSLAVLAGIWKRFLNLIRCFNSFGVTLKKTPNGLKSIPKSILNKLLL